MASRRRSRAEWERTLQEWSQSTESEARFCTRRDLALSTFRWWRWKLARGQGSAEAGTGWIELRPELVAFKEETSLRPDPSRGDLQLVLGDGIEVRIPVGFDEPTLVRLIRSLGVLEC